MTEPFVKQKDLDELKANGHSNPDVDIKLFLIEIRQYFNSTWGDNYYIEEEFESFEISPQEE